MKKPFKDITTETQLIDNSEIGKSNMTSSFLSNLKIDDSEPEEPPKFNQKLERARKRYRNFKNKLKMINIFLQKYQEKSLKNGKNEIYQAVIFLIEDKIQNRIKLSGEEEELFFEY